LIPWEQGPGQPFPIDTGKRWEITYQAAWRGHSGERVVGNIVHVLVEE
jgi:hypothetical protein